MQSRRRIVGHKGLFSVGLGIVIGLSLFICCDGDGFYSTVTAEIDDTFTLPCYDETVQSGPVRTLVLYKHTEGIDDRILIESSNRHSLGANSKSVLVSGTEIGDAGQYRCKSTDGSFQAHNFHTTVSVYAVPSGVTISAEHSTIQENVTQTVTCNVPKVYPADSLTFTIRSGGISVAQTRGGQYVPRSDETFRASFTRSVEFKREYNNAKLVCSVEFAFPGAVGPSLELDVIVQYCDGLSITGDNSQSPKPDGQQVTTTCTADCFPPRTITLYKGSPGDFVAESTVEQLSHSHGLTKQDNGLAFFCVVDGYRSSNVVYTVTFEASTIEITQQPSDIVPVDDPITIECLTNAANPTATIDWIGTTHTPVDDEEPGCCSASRRRSRLTFTARRQDNGGSVTCALQSNSNRKQTHTISVKFPPTAVTISTTTSNSLVVGDRKAFTCVTDSLNPVESVVAMRWTRGDSPGSGGIRQDDDRQFTHRAGVYGGRIVTSTYTFIATEADDGAYVTCQPRWREGGVTSITDIQQYQTLTVYYPPTVSIEGCRNAQNENETCTLSCDTTGGNPSTSISYRWQFKPKYNGVFEDLANTDDAHVLSDITYRDAGDYKCTVSNAGGSAQDTRTVTVRYAPVAIDLDPDSTDMKTFYANSSSEITMWLTVQNFPNNARFEWSKGRSNLADTVNRTDDRTSSSTTISSAGGNDYGRYNVRVTNDVGGNDYVVELMQKNKPDPATALRIESRSYREIIISFMPGLDGGFVQTITAEITNDGRSSSDGAGEIVNPVQQERHNLTISSNIDPRSTYVIRLTSDNAFNRGSATLSESINVTTRAKVKVSEGKLTAKLKGDDVILSWTQPVPDDFTALTIEQCRSDCIYHNVTGLLTVTLDRYNGTDCTLIVMQDRDTAYAASFQVEEEGGGDDRGGGGGLPLAVMIGAILGSLILVVLIPGLVVVILRKRRGGGENKKKEKSDAETPITAADDIMAVDPYAFENGAAPLRHTDNREEPKAPIYGKVDISKKKKNRQQQPAGEAAGDAPSVVYAQVDPRTKKNNRAPADTAESNQTSNSAPKSSQPHRPTPPNPSTRPKIEPKPAPNAPAESPYTNVPQPDLGENPYSNVQDLQQGNPAPSEPGAYAPSEQGPYANVSYPPPAAPAADTNNLIYADLSFDRGQPGTAPKPQIIHGAEDTVEYSTVDFNRSAPAPQESESEDEEDVNKRQ